MKKKLILVGFVGFTFLFGCSQIKNEVNENGENLFLKVGSEYKTNSNVIIQFKHKSTGCNFVYVDGDRDGGLFQMMIEKDGVTVPYCEGGIK